MVQRCEAIAVAKGDVCPALQEEGNHVISLLGDGVMKRCVSFRVLEEWNGDRAGT